LLLRLWRTGLWKTYRFFSLYLFVDLARTIVALFLEPGTNAYGLLYVTSVPADRVCAVLAVLEVYGLVLRKYAGIGTLGRWAISGALILSGVISLVSLYPDVGREGTLYPILVFVHALERAISSALLLFLLLITAFLVWFPIPLGRNVVVHTLVFGAYFSANALLLLLRNLVGANLLRVLSTINLGVATACLIAWLIFLSPAGEAAVLVFGSRWRKVDSERLVRQLDAINSSLMRAVRK